MFQPFVLICSVSVPGSKHRRIKISRERCSPLYWGIFYFCPMKRCAISTCLYKDRNGVNEITTASSIFANQSCDRLCTVCVGICDWLPVKGVEMNLGNDLAGGKVTPPLEIPVVNPHLTDPRLTGTFPLGAVVQAQTSSRT